MTTYIVTFEDMEVQPAIRCTDLAESTGGTVQYVYNHVLNGCALTMPLAQEQATFEALSRGPAVKSVEEDTEVFIINDSSNEKDHHFDPNSNSPLHVSSVAPSWGLDRINQCALPLDGIASKQDAVGAKVFIIDTGIYAKHEEFANGVIGPDDCHFSAFSNEIALSDVRGHG